MMEKAEISGTRGDEVGVDGGGWGWYVESPHVLISLFRANENGCRVSWGKNRERGGGEETRAGRLKEEEIARSECERIESGADQNGTGNGRRGKCKWPPD